MTDPFLIHPVLAREWAPGPDGVLRRDAARIVVLDGAGRVLLMRGHDDDGRSWWFTPGGGVDGQAPRDAAARELDEETGIVVEPGALVGPVWRRSAAFRFLGRRVRQDEVFFLAVIPDAPSTDQLSTAGWTDIEQDAIDEVRWFDQDDLEELTDTVYPADFAALVRPLRSGWDGSLIDLGYAEDET